MENVIGMNTNAAAQKLEQAVIAGTKTAGNLIKSILEEGPTDALVKARALTWSVRDSGVIELGVENRFPAHKHATAQVLSHLDIDSKGFRAMTFGDNAGPAPQWKRDLARQMLTEYFQHSGANHLVRRQGGEVRGFLSDKYRRLDSRPMVDAFVNGAAKYGAVPYSGTRCATKCSLKMIVPRIHEVIPGEPVAFGLEFGNSDFGDGGLNIRLFILRLLCLNGATAEDVMRQVHLGRRLSDDVEYSERTLRLDTEATVSALQDTVRSALLPEKREQMLNRIRAAQDESVTWDRLKQRLAKDLTKEELEKAKASFESPDVVNLPAEKTMWRASNALSWIAQQADSDDRKLDLERLAGKLLAA